MAQECWRPGRPDHRWPLSFFWRLFAIRFSPLQWRKFFFSVLPPLVDVKPPPLLIPSLSFYPSFWYIRYISPPPFFSRVFPAHVAILIWLLSRKNFIGSASLNKIRPVRFFFLFKKKVKKILRMEKSYSSCWLLLALLCGQRYTWAFIWLIVFGNRAKTLEQWNLVQVWLVDADVTSQLTSTQTRNFFLGYLAFLLLLFFSFFFFDLCHFRCRFKPNPSSIYNTVYLVIVVHRRAAAIYLSDFLE